MQTIRLLLPTDAASYRALRLRALSEHPEAFTSSFDEETVRPLSWSTQRRARRRRPPARTMRTSIH
mgnify:CR=1 FL=1